MGPSRNSSPPPAFVLTSTAEPIVAIGDDGDSVQIINLKNHKDPSQVARIPVGPLVSVSPLAMDADKDGRADFIFCGKEKVTMLSTSLPVASGSILWPTIGGSSLHSGGRPALYEKKMEQLNDSSRVLLEQTAQNAKAELDKGDYAKALEHSRLILNFNPRHREAQKVYDSAIAKTHRGSRALIAAVVLVLVLGFAFLIWRIVSTMRLIRRTNAMAEANEVDKILPAFRSHIRFHKGQKKVIAHLAALSQKTHLLPTDFTADLEKAHQSNPRDNNITLTLARIYLQQQKSDPSVIPFYEAACKAGGTTAPYEILLGNIFIQKGDYAAAHNHLKAAHDRGDRSAPLFDGLAQVYIGLGRISGRYVPRLRIRFAFAPR